MYSDMDSSSNWKKWQEDMHRQRLVDDIRRKEESLKQEQRDRELKEEMDREKKDRSKKAKKRVCFAER